ncbi:MULTISPECIES: MarR family winged helix-turn-helix transcriptional regulator [Thalassospira]|uniref:MarR family transcriptional regulator n=2 Tax=Thalassospira TaxID=168934 RepID=A0A367W8M1_9PROT|nr:MULTISPECIES: MarR family winged helix-turn-helix transcriptional regulator [Thalassospira]MDG4717980.1 MarR family winged helix-turn-helix transcriptional regulator [Thalassospira sp. FZY0004]RCK37763.1 MarR family transcriptional regulator [Thalassospira profundimaris]
MPQSSDPKQNIGFLMKDVTRLMRRNFMRHADEFGLTQAQMQALVYVARNEGIRQVSLAEMLEIQPITTARLIDKLVEEGLVERRADPDDRRAFQLFATDAATPLLDRIFVVAAAAREEAMAGITPEMQHMLVSLLRQMHENLIAVEPGGKPSDAAIPDCIPSNAKTAKPASSENA